MPFALPAQKPDARAASFRPTAVRNLGIWNEEGGSPAIVITPPWWRTDTFRAAAVGLLLALLWAAYQYRIGQVQQAFEATLEARVGERTRIARELHDTLLQGFHGVLLRSQTVSYLLPDRAAEAKGKLDGAIAHAAKTITEGRDAVQGLRASTVERNDLGVAIRTLGDELATDASTAPPPAFQLHAHSTDGRLPLPACGPEPLPDMLLRLQHRHMDQVLSENT